MKWVVSSLLLAAFPQEEPKHEDLVRRLSHESIEERARAAGELLALGEEALPALRKAAESRDPEVRSQALSIIDRLTWDSAIHPGLLNRYPELARAFYAGKHDDVLRFCLEKQIGFFTLDQELEAYLIRLLDHPHPYVRSRVTSRLSIAFEMPGTIPRRPIAKLAGLIAEWDPETYNDKHRNWLQSLAHVTFRRASPVDAPLLARTRARHPEAKLVLRILRASCGIEEEKPVLTEVLTNGPPMYRSLAFRVIGETKYGPARDVVARLLHDRTMSSAAASALVPIVDPSCREEVLKFFRETPARQLNRSHFRILLGTQAPEAAALLKWVYKHGEPSQKRCAVESLIELEDPEGMRLLLEKSIPVRALDAALVAARSVRGEEVRGLVDALAHEDKERRGKFRYALIFVQDRDAWDVMLRILSEDRRERVRSELFPAILATRFFRADPGAFERVATRIAGNPEDPLSIRAGLWLLQREATPERVVMGEAIVRVHGVKAASVLAALGARPNPDLTGVAGKILLESKVPYAAIPYLVKLGIPEAKRQLELAVREGKTKAVRKAAADALRDWGKNKDDEWRLVREAYELSSWGRRGDPELIAAAARGDEDARDKLRSLVRKEGVRPYVKSLSAWAHPEMISGLMEMLDGWDAGLPGRVRSEGISTCFPDFGRIYGIDIVTALAATGDRSLVPLFLKRLRDPDSFVRQVAIRTVTKWEVKEAVPALKAVVRSAEPWERARAIDALAELRAPGTVPFLLEVLRDNPHAAPSALARLGAKEAIGPLRNLLKDKGPQAATLGALDVLHHPEVYRNLDEPLEYETGLHLARFLPKLERNTGVPCRLSGPVREELLGSPGPALTGETSRECLNALVRGQTWQRSRYTHLYRNGAIEIVRVEDALREWRRKQAGEGR